MPLMGRNTKTTAFKMLTKMKDDDWKRFMGI
jgi:hypothetical protein